MAQPAERASSSRAELADGGLRRALTAMVRRSVPRQEVDEIVQATLADACASTSAPSEPEALERWVRGIARHKVADYHRRSRRELPVEPETLARVHATEGSAHDAADLLRWAERHVEDKGDGTIDWLLREGDGEKLETIAREEQLPAARVRQRVARLRRHFRARWAAQIAAAIVLGVLLFGLLPSRRENRHVLEATTKTSSSAAASVPAPSVQPPPAPSPLASAEPPKPAPKIVVGAPSIKKPAPKAPSKPVYDAF